METIISYILPVLQIIAVPVILFIVNLLTKIYRKVKLLDYKQEALVHAMQHETGNGFSEQYQKRLDELMKQDMFINYGKK